MLMHNYAQLDAECDGHEYFCPGSWRLGSGIGLCVMVWADRSCVLANCVPCQMLWHSAPEDADVAADVMALAAG